MDTLRTTVGLLHTFVFLAATLVGVAFFGSISPVQIRVFDCALLAFVLTTVLRVALEARRPRVGPALLVAVVALIALGWLMAWNARSFHEEEYWVFLPNPETISWLPGSLVGDLSRLAMFHYTILLVAFLALVDFAGEGGGRRAIEAGLLLVCLATAVLGLWQKLTDSPFLLGETLETRLGIAVHYPEHMRDFFGFYPYHGNAATLLALGLPIAAHRMVAAGRRTLRWGFGGIVLVLFAGFLANSSKAGHALLLVACALLLVIGLRRSMEASRLFRLKPILLLAGAAVCGGLVLWSEGAGLLERWDDFLLSWRGRWVGYVRAAELLPMSGWAGFGPGSFETVFAHQSRDLMGEFGVMWNYAHNDYLETTLEWGWLGVAGWVIVTFGWVPQALRRASFRLGACSLSPLLIATLLVTLHALVDMPFQIASLQWCILLVVALGWAGAREPSQTQN